MVLKIKHQKFILIIFINLQENIQTMKNENILKILTIMIITKLLKKILLIKNKKTIMVMTYKL